MAHETRDGNHVDAAQSSLLRANLPLVAILVLAGTVRVAYLICYLRSPLSNVEEAFTDSDMHTFSQWARRIAAGDVLCRDTYHPYTSWMEPIAPRETFERWWGGRHVYHQAPLYAYLLAISYAVTDSKVPMLLFQILLSVASVALVYFVGRRLLDRTAGLCAALIVSLFAPAIVLDSMLLRASTISFSGILTVATFLWLRDRLSARRGLAAGLVLGAGILLKPTWVLLAVACPAILLLSGARRMWKRWLPALIGGIVLCLAPVIARNGAVGAPLLSLSTRGAETAFQANNRYADPGFFQIAPPKLYADSMEKAQGSVFRSLAIAIATWPQSGPLRWWLSHEWRKLWCIFQDFEHANNTNFYYYRELMPLLHYFPTFGWMAGLALVGIVPLAIYSRDRRGAILLGAAALVLTAGTLLSFAHGRYRVPLAVLLAVPAGGTLSLLISWARQGPIWRAGSALVVAAALSLASFTIAPSRVTFHGDEHLILSRADSRILQTIQARRIQEPRLAAAELARRGDRAGAKAIMEEYLEKLKANERALLPTAGPAGQLLLAQHKASSLKTAAEFLAEIGFGKEAERLREAERH